MIRKIEVIHIFHACILGIGLTFLFSVSYVEAATSFTRNLTIGTRGADVQMLQVILNTDPATKITVSGPGSPGNETQLFGALTKGAVIRFQNKYGINPTGYVGPLTRAKLNVLLYPSAPAPSSSSSVGGSVSFSQAADYPETHNLRLYSATPYQVKPGNTLKMRGDNLGLSATLHLGDSYSTALISNESGTYQSIVPTSIPNGTYELWVTNTKGSSRNTAAPITVIVTDNPLPSPEITSISPKTISSLDQTITVTGNNFTGTVSVVSVFGAINGVSSSNDGTSLTFRPSQFPDQTSFSKIIQQAESSNIPIYLPFSVVTDGGTISGTFIVQ